MTLKQLKEILDREGGKLIVVEGDEPTLVILSFEEYMSRRAESSRQGQATEKELTIDDLPV